MNLLEMRQAVTLFPSFFSLHRRGPRVPAREPVLYTELVTTLLLFLASRFFLPFFQSLGDRTTSIPIENRVCVPACECSHRPVGPPLLFDAFFFPHNRVIVVSPRFSPWWRTRIAALGMSFVWTLFHCPRRAPIRNPRSRC